MLLCSLLGWLQQTSPATRTDIALCLSCSCDGDEFPEGSTLLIECICCEHASHACAAQKVNALLNVLLCAYGADIFIPDFQLSNIYESSQDYVHYFT